MNFVVMLAPPLVILCGSLNPVWRNCPGGLEDVKSQRTQGLRDGEKAAAASVSLEERRVKNATPTTFAEK